MKFVPERASRFVMRQKLKIDKSSPTILLVAGIAGVVGTTVLASRATLKAQPVLEATHLELEGIKYNSEAAFRDHGVRPNELALRKQRVAVYAQTAVQLTKLYGPAVVLGGLSIGCLVQSHKILNDRYSNMATAYVALQESFDRYRHRVIEEIGEEKEKEIYYDAQDQVVIEMGPNGPKKKKIKIAGDGGGSIYARFFGPGNINWKSVPEYNTLFLRQVESHCNVLLRTKGHLFLNKVYDELGLEDSEEGAVCGWLYERGTGDNYVDFGIWDETEKNQLWNFMVGNEGEILLDFNVDGPIHKMLNKQKVH